MTPSNRLFQNNLLCFFLFYLLDYPLIFPEDADIRIPPEPAKGCPAKLEVKIFLIKKINKYKYIFNRKNLKNIINDLEKLVLIKMF